LDEGKGVGQIVYVNIVDISIGMEVTHAAHQSSAT